MRSISMIFISHHLHLSEIIKCDLVAYLKAFNPVTSSPVINKWISCVPS